MSKGTRVASVALVAAAAVFSAPHASWAKSKAYNGYTKQIDIFWGAAGCGAVKYPCGKSDLGTICKHEKAAPGETKSYDYKAGTSGWRIGFADCSTYDNHLQAHGTSNNDRNHHCAIYPSGDTFASHCGYSDDEFQNCQNDSSKCSPE